MDSDAAESADPDVQDHGILSLDELLALASGHAPPASGTLRRRPAASNKLERRQANAAARRPKLFLDRKKAQRNFRKGKSSLHARLSARRTLDQIGFHERSGYAKTDDFRIQVDAQRRGRGGAVGKASGKGKGSKNKPRGRGAQWKRWTPAAILRGASSQPNSAGSTLSTSIDYAGNSAYFQTLKMAATCITRAQRDGLKGTRCDNDVGKYAISFVLLFFFVAALGHALLSHPPPQRFIVASSSIVMGIR